MRKKRSKNVREYYLSLFSLCLLLVMAILSGCGSGGGDATAPAVTTGTFVDGPVAGLNYSTATLSGVTGADGSFQYRTGETITFSAGEIVLGSTVGKSVISPVDLVASPGSSANMKAVNISRFLQLVDADGDHSNGIEITQGIRDLLTWNTADGTNDGSIFADEASVFTTGTFTAFVDSVLTTLNGASVFSAVTPRSRASRTATAARRNLNTTLSAISAHPFSPVVREVGIGVTNLNVSMLFYQNIMNLQFAGYQGKADRVEASYEDNRTTNKHKVVLMEFNDAGIDCTDRPAKLVFAIPSGTCSAYYSAITGGGGSAFSPCAYQPTLYATVGMAKDPDGYLLELIESAAVSAPYLSGIGIGVAAIQPMDDFYTRVLGMRFNYYLPVTGFMNEMIMQSPQSPTTTYSTGVDIVLMDYANDTGRVYADLPAKIVFTVADPAAVTQTVGREGLTIIQSSSSGVRGIAKDPSGLEVEFAAP